MNGQGNRVPIITNFTEYFREERDVYVQNRSNTQVSLQFELIVGRTESILIPKGKKPINLTQLVPFHAIKASTDLRKMVNRRPPVLVLMDEGEYLEYYEKLGAQYGISAEEAIDMAHQEQSDLQNRRTFTKPSPEPRKTIEQMAEEREAEPMDPQDKVTARVVGICNSVGDDVEEKDRMKAGPMLDELRDLDEGQQLTRGDLEYLLGHGFYPSVKKWAERELGARF